MTIQFTNNASATLAAAINTAATSLSVASGQGAFFPALAGANYFYATLVDASNNLEIVKCTARSGDVLTITRAQDGTSARSFVAGDKLELRVTAAGMNAKHDTEDFNARSIGTAGGLTGGGNLSADRTLSIADLGVVTAKIADANVTTAKMDASGVTAGVYGSSAAIPSITVNAQGRVTAASTSALDLSTKANTGGGNATGTWPIGITGNAGTATAVAWTGVTSRPTALSSFTNDIGAATTVSYTSAFSSPCCGSPTATEYALSKTGANIHLYRTNCNCACSCCFAKGTLVKLADGSVKPIELVVVGDKVVGMSGEVTVAHRYDTTIKNNSLWLVNRETLVTGGHLFNVDGEWAAADISAYPENVFFRSEQVFDGVDLVDVKHQSSAAESVRELRIGDVVNGVEVKSISRIDADRDFEVHNLIVHGGDTFQLGNGFIVDGFHRTAIGVAL